MVNILLCSSNQILVKSIYCILRDAGHDVDTVEHPSVAVQKVLAKKYDAVIIDSDPFGLSAEDAFNIIKSVAPDLPVLFINDQVNEGGDPAAGSNLEKITRVIHAITA